jgi:AraC family transcriptional regulator of adaptative response/methylated-DNA-[protein]-cysteine methyltransferase
MQDPRWQQLVARDRSADGTFYYSVQTTGIYCRPSCGARLARPEHVCFHASCAEAEQAGFRPCKRCKPDQTHLLLQHAAKIAAACRLIEAAPMPPALAALAEHVGMSTYHFHRIFVQQTGLTPRQYACAQRAQRMRLLLQSTPVQHDAARTVTDAVFSAGYNASSRFYEEAKEVLGMTPQRYRSGGVNEDIRFAIGQCSLGAILVAQSSRGICAILMGDDPEALARDLQERFRHANLIGGDPGFEQFVAQVIGFVEAPQLGLGLPLDVRGTAFQQRVWQALRAIPVGQTATYTEIAERIGAPSAVRAVASACAANALAVAIPCHRVVRIDGNLSGYRWGVARKRSLLEQEAKSASGKNTAA